MADWLDSVSLGVIFLSGIFIGWTLKSIAGFVDDSDS